MARFTVRVELRDAKNGEDYRQLHEAMEAEGFSPLVRAGKGKQYRLPTGEYRINGRHTRAQVHTAAKRGAASVGRACAILVTEGPCSWYNLADSGSRGDKGAV